jgi:D-glycero-D-manno-heptose 1,7-bisphosphate phosphatase
VARRFVALDRDGCIIVERHYLADPLAIELLPGAAAGLRHMRSVGLGVIVLTNQSAVGRGFFDEAHLARIHHRLLDLLQAEGVHLDGLYYCPHTSDEQCRCRKPQPGLLERAARERGFAMQESFVVGDKACDIELGRRVGATTLLVRTGYGAQVAAEGMTTADHIVDSLWEAAQVIERLMAVDRKAVTDAAQQ